MADDSRGSRHTSESSFRQNRIPSTHLLVVAAVLGSSTAYAETWRFTPSISLVETLTDNVELTPPDRQQGDLITQITPGLRIVGTGRRVQLQFNYRMNNLLYANNSSRNNIQNYLDAVANVEAVENWLFVEARGNISQQGASAFAPQPTTTGSLNANRAETATYQFSPYIRGRLASAADYQLRYRWSTTAARGTQLADTELVEWSGNITGRTGMAALGWALDGSTQNAHYNAGRDTETARARASLISQFDPQVRVTATGGYEQANYTGAGTSSSATYGGRLEWAPTERTRLSAYKEKRNFGNSHEFAFTHRTPLSAWQLSDRKDITFLPNQLVAGRGTAYDRLFDALATRFPDPVLRAEEVERQLQQNGIPPDLLVPTAFLTTRVFVQRSRQASVALIGARNTVTFAAVLSESNAIGGNAGTSDDFARTTEVQQRSLSVAWGHRLSALSSVNLLVSQIHSTGGGAGRSLESTQSTARLLLSHTIAPKATGSLGIRYVDFDRSTGGDFREKAVTGALHLKF